MEGFDLETLNNPNLIAKEGVFHPLCGFGFPQSEKLFKITETTLPREKKLGAYKLEIFHKHDPSPPLPEQYTFINSIKAKDVIRVLEEGFQTTAQMP